MELDESNDMTGESAAGGDDGLAGQPDSITAAVPPAADVVVVGGGIAGLIAAISCAGQGLGTVVLDARAPGGRAHSMTREGFIYNAGPHALYPGGALDTFLGEHAIPYSGRKPPSSRVGLVRGGEVHQLGFDPVSLARTPLLHGRDRVRLLTTMARLMRVDPAPHVGSPWGSFLATLPPDVAAIVATIARTSTYVDAADTFDAGAALGQLRSALRGVLYLDGGWATIVDGLLARLRALGGVVVAGATVVSVGSGSRIEVATTAGPVTAGATIIAGLSPAGAARLVGTAVEGLERLGPPAEAAVLDLALRRPHKGLVLGLDCPLYLSPHAPTARLAPTGHGLVSLLRYLRPGDAADAAVTPAVDRQRLRDLATVAGISASDVAHERYLHRMTVCHGIPVASGGGLAGRPGVTSLGVDGVFVAGDWVGGVGQLADASAASARVAADSAVAFVRRAAR